MSHKDISTSGWFVLYWKPTQQLKDRLCFAQHPTVEKGGAILTIVSFHIFPHFRQVAKASRFLKIISACDGLISYFMKFVICQIVRLSNVSLMDASIKIFQLNQEATSEAVSRKLCYLHTWPFPAQIWHIKPMRFVSKLLILYLVNAGLLHWKLCYTNHTCISSPSPTCSVYGTHNIYSSFLSLNCRDDKALRGLCLAPQ